MPRCSPPAPNIVITENETKSAALDTLGRLKTEATKIVSDLCNLKELDENESVRINYAFDLEINSNYVGPK